MTSTVYDLFCSTKIIVVAHQMATQEIFLGLAIIFFDSSMTYASSHDLEINDNCGPKPFSVAPSYYYSSPEGVAKKKLLVQNRIYFEGSKAFDIHAWNYDLGAR